MQQVHCYTCISSYNLYSCLASILQRQKRHITITDLEATVPHGIIAAHCSCIFCQIFLYVTICQFTLHILMNYVESVTNCLCMCEQWIRDTPLRFLSFKCLGTGLISTVFNLCTLYHYRHLDSFSSVA